jgi:hypothetical protein
MVSDLSKGPHAKCDIIMLSKSTLAPNPLSISEEYETATQLFLGTDIIS